MHFHLLELAHAEDELASNDFVAECFTDLGDAEGDAHAAGLLHVEVVDEDTLGSFGAEVHGHGTVGGGAHFGFEHEVELAHFGPVLGAGDGVNDFFVEDDLAQCFEVVGVHGFGEASVDGFAVSHQFHHAGVGLAEHSFVEAVAETLAGFGHFFVDFFIDFGDVVFDEHVGAVALFGVAVVDEGVVESVHVAGSFPDGGVHKDSRIDSHNVFVEQRHGFPPVTFDVIFEFDAVLAVVINSRQAVVDFA